MPIFYQQHINEHTRLAVWHIEEDESFFLEKVPLQQNIVHPHKRLQHLAGRYLLQYLSPDFPYELILIADSRQPYLPDARYHFSISHCGDFAAAIISTQQRVGIDVENITPRLVKAVHKFLHPDEYEFVKDRLSDNSLLTMLWGAKEAMYKWWGNGGIDFCEDMRLEPFVFDREGHIDAALLQQGEKYPLQLQYKLFDDISLVWAV